MNSTENLKLKRVYGEMYWQSGMRELSRLILASLLRTDTGGVAARKACGKSRVSIGMFLESEELRKYVPITRVGFAFSLICEVELPKGQSVPEGPEGIVGWIAKASLSAQRRPSLQNNLSLTSSVHPTAEATRRSAAARPGAGRHRAARYCRCSPCARGNL